MTKFNAAPDQDTGKAYLTVNDVAEYFGCGVSTVWRLAKNGTLPKPVHIGGMTRWRKSEIEASFAEQATF